MKTKPTFILGLPLVAFSLLPALRRGFAQPPQNRIVRIAELEIYPDRLDAYKLALSTEIASSLQTEPGVLTLYAVSVKAHPEQIRLFEIYRDAACYQAHLQSPHLETYKQQTQHMVKSLKLIQTHPILLGSKLK